MYLPVDLQNAGACGSISIVTFYILDELNFGDLLTVTHICPLLAGLKACWLSWLYEARFTLQHCGSRFKLVNDELIQQGSLSR